MGDYTGISFDTNSSGNGAPIGITWDGTYFWVTDLVDAEVYRYNANGSYSSLSFDTVASGNGAPYGITWDGTYFWVTDLNDDEVYRYDSSGTYSGFSFDTAGSGNSTPGGITWDGTYFSVTDFVADEIYRYNANGSYSSLSFDTAVNGSDAPIGITWDGTYFWMTDSTDGEVYRYNPNGTYSGFSFDTAASGNATPYGITWDGTYFWVVDFVDVEVYKYEGTSGTWPPGPPPSTSRLTLARPPNNLGLVGYWSFNEGTGTIATDFSGRGYHGAVNGNTAWVNGTRGKALNFGGVTADHVNIGTTLDFQFPFTVSAWVNPSNYGYYRAFFSKRDADQPDPAQIRADVGLHDGNGNVYIFDGSGAPHQFSYSPPLNTWTHITVVASSTGAAVYANGVQQAIISSFTLGTDSGANVRIGTAGDGDDQFIGSIDEVRLYSRELSASEIAKLAQSGAVKFTTSSVALQSGSTLASGLVGHWTFDGPDVTDKVYDRSGQGNHGYFIGGATSSAKTIGKLGQALIFDNTNDYVEVSDHASLQITGQLSIAFWLNKTNYTGGFDNIIAKDNGFATSGWWFEFGANTDEITFFFYTDAQQEVSTTNANLALGRWYHVVMTYNDAANNVVFYIDGVPMADDGGSAETNSLLSTAGDNLRIGELYDGEECDCSLDDVRIYNRALSPTEIQQLYKLGTVRITQ